MTIAQQPIVLHPDELPAHDRGNGASTVPLVTAQRGATTYLTGITKFAAGSQVGHHSHNVAESVMVIKGDAIVDIDGERTSLRTYDTTFVPANIPHHFENASPDGEMWILWVYGSLDATRTLIAQGVTGRVDDESAALPGGVGNAIMDAFQIPPSRLIGELKRALEAAVDAGEIAPRLESEAYVEFVAQNRERFGV